MAKANVVNTRIVATETTVRPYYDDFSEEKNFHKILFRPGYAVQGRELTQLQTILQNQIERFGLHIFENGSSVIGGEMSLADIQTLNLSSTYQSSTIIANDFLNKTIRYGDANNMVVARVVNTSEATDTDPASLHLRYLTGDEFTSSDTIKVESEEIYANVVPTANTTANGLMAFIYDSIYFYNGYFIKVPQQNIILSKYDVLPNVRVGLELTDDIVTSESDSSLLDPALESSNYQAPGAARYVVELNLAKRDLDSTDDSKFIEIARIEKGGIRSKVEYPVYGEIEEVLKRRTFDESGSYTTKEFVIRMDDNADDSTNNVSAFLSPGKAYILGAEYKTLSDTEIAIPRARTTESVSNYDLNLNYGNYVIVDGLEGFFDPSTQEVVDIHTAQAGNIDFANQGTYDTTKIGTARVRDIQFYSGDVVAADRKHELYIFDTRFSSGDFAQANSFIKHSSYTVGASSNANANITILNKDNGLLSGNSTVSEPSLSTLVFPLPEKYITEGTLANQSYRFSKKYTSVSFSAGVSTAIIAGTDEQFIGTTASSNVASTVMDNFLVIVSDPLASGRAVGEQVKVNVSITGDPEEATFDTEVGGADTFTASVLAKMEIDGTSAGQRSKTLVLANTSTLTSDATSNTFINGTGSTTNVYINAGQITIENPSRTPDVRESLFLSDVISIKKIYDLDGAAIPAGGSDITVYTDVTSKYQLDSGQRDTYYDHASIRLRPGVSAPAGPLIVCARVFKSSASENGYFSVDSYPSLGTDIIEETVNLGTGYSIIPTYTNAAGEKLFLRDCIDFRPVRKNASNTTPTFVLNGVRVPVATSDFQTDYEYYLGRRDLLVLTSNRALKRIAGIPGKFPQNPSKPTNSMVLYSLGVSPYTSYPANVAVKFVDNRRYTMRDIGLIDKRLKDVEYYVTLNTLEKDALDINITDVDGLTRTKFGILADNFTGHSLGDSARFDYQCAVDYKQGWLQPKSNTSAVKLEVDTATINSVEVNDEKITLSYTEEDFVSQNTATKFTAVAEFLFADFEGQLITIPESDIWKSVNASPTIVNTTFENNQSFDTITVSSQRNAEDAINDVIGGNVGDRRRR